MALIQCPECGKEISDKAKKCPNCGYQIRKINKLIPLLAAIVIIAICGIVIFQVLNSEKDSELQQEVSDNTEAATEIMDVTDTDIVKEQEEKYSRYVDLAISNTKGQLNHSGSIVLNKVIVSYIIEENVLTTVNVAIDFSSENNYGMMQRGYSTNVAYPEAVDDPNYMNTVVTSDNDHYNHYYLAVTSDGYLNTEFQKVTDEYYEGTVDGRTEGYFTYNIEDINY